MRLAAIAGGIAVVILAGAIVLWPRGGAGRWVSAGYVPYWDQERGFDEAVAHSRYLTDVSPWWYSVAEDGSVVPQDASVNIDPARVLELQAYDLDVIPSVANHTDGEWDVSTVRRVLRDDELRDAHVAAIVQLVVSMGFDGIDIDYEQLGALDREPFSTFVRELGDALHDEDKLLSVTVHAKESDVGYGVHNVAQDYEAIGEAADQVRVMAYDWHAPHSSPGPVAPLDWVDSVLRWAVTQIPSERIVLGVPLYGYDWGGSEVEALTVPEALRLAAEKSVLVQRDAVSGSSWFVYRDDAGVEHTVWFEDATSARRKVELAGDLDLGGVFFWRFGDVEAELWGRLSPQR